MVINLWGYRVWIVPAGPRHLSLVGIRAALEITVDEHSIPVCAHIFPVTALLIPVFALRIPVPVLGIPVAPLLASMLVGN